MDRRTALDALELIRPDANDLRDPEFADALAYLETDEPARELFARRQKQDRQIAQAMRDVPVPEGAKARLLSLLTDESEKPAVADPPSSRTLKSRRWFLSACVVVASCLLAAVGFWFFGEKPPQFIALEELEAEAPFESDEVAKLPVFSGSFEPVRPDGLWSESRFAFSSSAKGYLPDSEGSHRVAVYEFFFRDPQERHPGDLRGVMLIVPKSELSNPPESQSFFDGAYVTYQAKPRVAIRSWTEGERVYICLVPIEHFEALSRVLFDIQIG